ncbi:hypothetical protein BGZ51_003577 [Haplosporangium sp. Z 767]|nr:hypothetical protein BGZ51_003577 [Haplosporangium sp. Z 767]KAF9187237.1 hypothetical protein BGZ50_002033 [Haplosporangium sp. Z 11]
MWAMRLSIVRKSGLLRVSALKIPEFYASDVSALGKTRCESNCATISPGAALMTGMRGQGEQVQRMNLDSIPSEYRSNLQQVLATCHYPTDPSALYLYSSSGIPGRVWAQTRSGELVFFQGSVLQWSTACLDPILEL